MAKKSPSKKSRKSTDGKRVSSQKHEIAYTGGKVARKTGSSKPAAKQAVKKAKKGSRTVSRPRVESKAEALVT